jgi:type I restriction enzyme S subunit
MNEAAMSTVLEIGSRWKPYPTYKDSGVEWLEEIPTHWKIAPLKREFEVQLGKMLQNEPSTSGDTLEPYLRAANITWQGVDLSDIKEMWFSPGEKQKYTLKIGDLLVSEGGDVGRSALWRGELPYCYIQNAINRARSNGLSTTLFLFYWMYTLKEHGYIDMLCNKATISHFTAEKVQEVPVMFPPPSEQHAIASFLDREITHIDILIAKKERLIELLTEKRSALISHVVTKGLNPTVPMKDSGVEWIGEIPAHWEVKRLKHISPQIGVGVVVTPSQYVSDSGVPFLFGADIGEGRLRASNARRITLEDSRRLKASILRPRDIVTIRVGVTRGWTSVIPPELDEANCASILITRGHYSFSSDWLCYAMNSRLGRSQIERVEYGAAQPQFNVSHAVEFVFPVPPLEEQKTIALSLTKLQTEIDSVLDRIEQQIALLKEYRTALISAAVSGKIDVRGEAA